MVLIALLAGAARAEPITIETRAVPLNSRQAGLNHVGQLEFLAGFEIESPAPDWGGFSGLLVSADGERLLAVSDYGRWFRARLDHAADGRLITIEAAALDPVLDENGRPSTAKILADAEALALDGGGVRVAFEQRHRIERFAGPSPTTAAAQPVAGPSGLDTLPANKGIEVMTRLGGGDYLLLSEGGRDANDDLRGWVGHEGAWSELTLVTTGDFAPVDATLLPGSDVLLLERRFSALAGPGARLSIIAADSIRPGARLAGKEIARLELPMTVDNFEAIAARPSARGVLVYLMSDDNRSLLQRTLLLQFRLKQ